MNTTAAMALNGKYLADDGAGSHVSVVADHYQVDLAQPLGTGGMSVIYLARDLKNRRPVALRTLRLEYSNDPTARARFRKEARTMAFVQHPNVARVYDLWEDDSSTWVATEYVPGLSLKELVERDGPLEPYDASVVLNQAADALTTLHDSGMVHLDVKPSNLIWSEDGVVKLIDFGLAQVANQPQELIGGLAYGTAAYLSPEQASGQPVGPASDTYSLGCVVYELLAGRPPFAREDGFESSERLLRAHLDEQPDPPSLVNPGRNIPGWADELVMWALLKRPDDRIRNPADLSHFFQLGAAGELTAVDVRRLRADGTPQPARQISDSSTAGAVGHSSVSIPRKKPLLLRIALPFQSTLWRFVMAMAVANLFLAAVLYINRGSVPGLIDGESDLQAGSQARVTVADLNFRGEPGLSSPSMALLEKGTMVKITGHRVEADAEVWWPVSLESGGRTLMGYLWEGGIEPQDVSLRKRLDRALSNLWEDAKSAAGL